MNATIVEYIKDCRAKNFKDEEIKQALLNTGYQEADISIAFQISDNKILPPPPPINSPLPITNAKPHFWDTFEHFLMFVSMYVMAIATAFILHYFVDK